MIDDTRRKSLASVALALSWTAEQRGELVTERALGRAAPSPEHPGRFEADLGDQEWQEDSDRDLLLRFADGAGQRVDRVVRAASGILVVEVDHVPSDGTATLVAKHDPSRLPAAASAAIAGLDEIGLAGAVLDGDLDPAPSERAGPSYLNDQQRRAVATMVEPGFHAVWAPPGSGATTVVAEAVSALIDQGRSVLLMTSSPSAADDAVERLWAARSPAPGTVVRLGPTRSTPVAEHPAMTLDRAAAQRRKPLVADRKRLERHLADLDRSHVASEWAEVTSQLDRADAESLQTAWRRTSGPERITHLESEIARLIGVRTDREETLARLRAEAERIDGLLSLDPADVWRRIEQAEADDEAAHQAVERHDREHHTAQLARDSAIHKLGALPAYRIVERRRTGAEVDHHEAILAELDEARRAAREDYDEQHATFCRLRLELQHQLPPECDAEWWADLQAQHATATIAVDQAEIELWELGTELARLKSELADVRADPPTPLDYELVEKISPNLADLRARRDELAGAHHRLLERRAQLEEELAAIDATIESVEHHLVDEADAVVTTPAALIDNEVVGQRSFDAVIVDRAGTTDLPFLVLAAALADRSVTMVGDFCRPGPVVDPKPGLHSASSQRLDDDARYWLVTEPFHHFGLRAPADAENDRGCITLTRQYRLGKTTEGLLNRLVYDDVLWSAPRWHNPVDDGRGELVLIDTSDLSRSQRWIVRDGPSRHWPLGVVLAGRLMELHPDATMGLVAPHQAQADLLRALVADSDRREQVAAGTIDALGDRSFDVVVIDLATDRWHTTGFADPVGLDDGSPSDDVRAVVAALSCTRGRVYLIGDAQALSEATSDRDGSGNGNGRDASAGTETSNSTAGSAGLLPVGEPRPGPVTGLVGGLADLLGRGLDVVEALQLLDDGQLLNGSAPVGTSPGDVGKLVRVHPKASFYTRLDELAGQCRQRLDVWSPYYSERRIRTLGRRWAATARNGRIHARVLPARTDEEQRALAALERSGIVVASDDDVSERLVVGDGHLVLWGSLDVLSSNRRTELMTEMDSPTLARLLRARADGYPV
jgi:hypothetical protein